MVFHCAGIRHIVVKHGTVRRDPGDAFIGLHRGEIFFAATDLHALGDMPGFNFQNIIGLRLIVRVHNKEEQQNAGEQNRKADQKCVAKDFCCHTPSPPIL